MTLRERERERECECVSDTERHTVTGSEREFM